MNAVVFHVIGIERLVRADDGMSCFQHFVALSERLARLEFRIFIILTLIRLTAFRFLALVYIIIAIAKAFVANFL